MNGKNGKAEEEQSSVPQEQKRRQAPDPSHQAQGGPVRAESLHSLGIPELQIPVLSVRLAREILQSRRAKILPDEIWPPGTR